MACEKQTFLALVLLSMTRGYFVLISFLSNCIKLALLKARLLRYKSVKILNHILQFHFKHFQQFSIRTEIWRIETVKLTHLNII